MLVTNLGGHYLLFLFFFSVSACAAIGLARLGPLGLLREGLGVPLKPAICYFLFFAVFADCLNAFAVGAPLVPGFLIFSLDPPAMRLRFACMFAYSPRFLAMEFPFYHFTL